MATLTQTAYFARKAIKYGSIAFVALIIIRAGYITFRKFVPVKPPPPPAPNVAFGKLPKAAFPQKDTLNRITYRLETISGGLPQLPTQAKVYFMPDFSAGFMTEEKIITWAKSLGFSSPPQKPDPNGNEDIFTMFSPITNTLKVNLLTRNFNFSYDWRNDPGFAFQTLPETNQAVSQAAGFLQLVQSLNEDIDPANNRVVPLKVDNNNLIESLLPEANFYRINFYRMTPDNLKILPADPKNGNIFVTVSGIKNNFNGVIEAQYIYHLISTEISATYPLKSATDAWQQLLDGNGFIANMGENLDGNVIIRNSYLAYYEPSEKQPYLQPIVVFEGDRDFVAYVPAIIDSLFSQ